MSTATTTAAAAAAAAQSAEAGARLSDRAVVCVLKHLVVAHGADTQGRPNTTACLGVRLVGRQWAALLCRHHVVVPRRVFSATALLADRLLVLRDASDEFARSLSLRINIEADWPAWPLQVLERLQRVGGAVFTLDRTGRGWPEKTATLLAAHCAQARLVVPADGDADTIGPDVVAAFTDVEVCGGAPLLLGPAIASATNAALGAWLLACAPREGRLRRVTARLGTVASAALLAERAPHLALVGFTEPLPVLAFVRDFAAARALVAQHGAPLLARLAADASAAAFVLAGAAADGAATFDEVRAWLPHTPLAHALLAAYGYQAGTRMPGEAQRACLRTLVARGLDVLAPFGGAETVLYGTENNRTFPGETPLTLCLRTLGCASELLAGVDMQRTIADAPGGRSYMEHAVAADDGRVVAMLAAAGARFSERVLLAAAGRRNDAVFAAAAACGPARWDVAPGFAERLMVQLWGARTGDRREFAAFARLLGLP